MATFDGDGDGNDERGDVFAPTAKFGQIGDDFIAQADATYSLLQLAYELADRPINFSVADEGLSKDQRTQVRGGIRSLAQTLLDSLDKGEHGRFSVDLGSDPDVSQAVQRIVFSAAHQVKMPSRNLLVRRSMLLLAVSDFELLMGQVAALIMELVPGVASAGEASITLSELELLDDVRAARRVVIDRKIDDLLRQSMDKWVAWFDGIGVKWKDMTDDWCQFAEIFARRNVVVHAGAKTTAQYLTLIRSAGCKVPEHLSIGTKLELDDAYLTETSERLLAFGVLLVAGSWLQVSKGNTRSAESWITSRSQHLLELQHPRAVDAICRTVLSRSRGRLLRKTELLLQTMSWVARKETGDGDKVHSEVEKWETSGTDLLYAHVKAVLLDDDDLAVRQIVELRRRNDLTVVDLVVSPLYRDLLDRRRADLLPEGLDAVTREIVEDDEDDDPR